MFNPQLPENNPTWVQSSPPCERCEELTRERDEARARIATYKQAIADAKQRCYKYLNVRGTSVLRMIRAAVKRGTEND